jgi:uncharacterized protein DUF6714
VLTLAPTDDELEESRARAALWQQIDEAFAAEPRPEPPVTEGVGPFNDDVEQALAGKPADRVTAEDAGESRLGLWLLTPAAFRYYLPALLRHVLVPERYVDGLGEAVFDVLVPRDDAELGRVFGERMKTLTESERAALAGFVNWYLGEESIVPLRDQAAAYWF